MLTMTPTAAEAVRQLVSGTSIESSGGVRISPAAPSPASAPLQVAVAPSPETTDQTIDETGARVFVASDATEFLDDKVLDAEVDAGRVRFAIMDTRGDTSAGPRPA